MTDSPETILAVVPEIRRVMRRFDLQYHPLVYAILPGGKTVYDPDDTVKGERYKRCPNCEQWSPCDVRVVLEALRSSAEGR